MNEEFIKRLYETSIIDGLESYKNQFNNTVITDKTAEFTKKALDMYQSLTSDQKEVFFEVLKITMIDTISLMFGVLDGSSTLNGGYMDVKMSIDGKDTEEELQDTFLEYVENIEG
ncbi:MAG: transposase mutator type [Anaerocolumna sp.]|jgi:hypothetical protein|nr:transposase mutator type [Anaerocolumna sp.]